MPTSFMQRIAGGGLAHMEEEIPTLNCGGCGLVALHIGEILEECGIEFDIVYLARYMKHGSATDEHILDLVMSGESTPNSHIVIRAEGLTVDSNGDISAWFSEDEGLKEYGVSSLSTLHKMIYERPDQWNCQFNRDWNEDFVSKMITDLFEEDTLAEAA